MKHWLHPKSDTQPAITAFRRRKWQVRNESCKCERWERADWKSSLPIRLTCGGWLIGRRRMGGAVTALVLSLLLTVGHGDAQIGPSNNRQSSLNANRGRHLGVQSTIGELLRHPAFAGFSRLILPWDDRDYDEQMPLTAIGSLLPYHSHVDPETV